MGSTTGTISSQKYHGIVTEHPSPISETGEQSNAYQP
jgi:hypothetical protein